MESCSAKPAHSVAGRAGRRGGAGGVGEAADDVAVAALAAAARRARAEGLERLAVSQLAPHVKAVCAAHGAARVRTLQRVAARERRAAPRLAPRAPLQARAQRAVGPAPALALQHVPPLVSLPK